MELLLKAASAEAFEQALLDSGVKVTETVQVGEDTFEDRVRLADGLELDVIGVISKPTGEMTEATETMPAMPVYAAIEGYHANLRGSLTPEMIEGLAPITMTTAPAVRYRVWG